MIIINNIDVFSLILYKYDRLQWFWCDIFATKMFEPNILSQLPPPFFFKNKNNQKVRLESINDIKKHFQNNDQETLVLSNGSNIIYTHKNCNIDIVIILLCLHLLLSNGYFRSYPRFDIRFLEGSKSINT